MTFDMDFDDPAGDHHDHTETLTGNNDTDNAWNCTLRVSILFRLGYAHP